MLADVWQLLQGLLVFGGCRHGASEHLPCPVMFFSFTSSSAFYRGAVRFCYGKAVCLSVCLSVKRVHCDKTKELSANILIPYERSTHLAF